jgi:hypothetical protein
MRIEEKSLLAVLLLLCVAAISLCSFRSLKKSLAEAQNNAKQQFQQLSVSSPDPRHTLVGSSATIVRTEETGGIKGLFGGGSNYVLAVYARNEYGEYFMFRSSSAKPYIKHLSQEAARQVLGTQYQVPATGDA